jgi:hypothetical protein
MPVDMSVDKYGIQKKIDVLGFPGIAATALGNSCDISMQVNADELEVNVRNEDSSNQALKVARRARWRRTSPDRC